MLFADFFAKSVTAGELEQEGADIRAWLGIRDEFFLSDFVFSEFLHSQHGAKALPLLAVRECDTVLRMVLTARGGSRQLAEPAERRCPTALLRLVLRMIDGGHSGEQSAS